MRVQEQPLLGLRDRPTGHGRRAPRPAATKHAMSAAASCAGQGMKLAIGVHQGYAVVAQNSVDLRLVVCDQPVQRGLPLPVGGAHAHGDLVVEAHARFGGERDQAQARLGPALDEEACDRAPHDCDVDLALDQVLFDDLAGIELGVGVEHAIRHPLVHQLVLGQPRGGGRAVVHADAQPLQLIARERQEVLDRLHVVQAAPAAESPAHTPSGSKAASARPDRSSPAPPSPRRRRTPRREA